LGGPVVPEVKMMVLEALSGVLPVGFETARFVRAPETGFNALMQ